MKTPVVLFVGRSGTGKTTLLVKVVRALKRKGRRVGTVKHFKHDFETDKPGKDSYRHFHAGAALSAIVSPRKLALVQRLRRPPVLKDIVRAFYGEADLVLVEGFKRQKGPKIEVLGGNRPVCRPRGDGLIALVSDVPVAGYPQPRFKRKEAAKVVQLIEERCLCRTRSAR